MRLDELETAVRTHAGEFHCVRIGDEALTKVVRFAHLADPPTSQEALPDIGRLRDFYDTFGSLVLYHDDASGDAARHIAAPVAWAQLDADFSGWFDGMDDDEIDEYVPAWARDALVIGETPRSGNYILMATTGDIAGQVFEFDHDGFEFRHVADDLVEYVHRFLTPDNTRLVDMASHMRFIDGDPMSQWWIGEMRDNRGHVATTAA